MMARMNAKLTSASNSGFSGGKIVVIGIFGVALLAAGAGLIYKYFASQRPLEMWGAEGVQVIQKASQVELLSLEENTGRTGTAQEDHLSFGGHPLLVNQRRDISKAQGLIHHRHFLTESVTYIDLPVAASELRPWTHAVVFRDGVQTVTVLFDLNNDRLGNLQAGREVRINAKIADNWQRFIDRQK